MSDFDYMSALEVTNSATASYTLHQINLNDRKSPTLIVHPATEANSRYFNALLQRTGRNASQVASGKINAGMISDNRDEDRELYPNYVVSGWEDVVDSDGKAVKFTPANVADFINALPGWVFDDLRAFCGKPHNFVGDTVLNVDVGTTGKN